MPPPPALVLDHDLLLPDVGQLLGHQAGEDVGRLAGRERHDEAHGLGGPRRLRARAVAMKGAARASATAWRRVIIVIVPPYIFPETMRAPSAQRCTSDGPS